jgi:nucleoside-diphosphate-sugar epimerase
MKLAITGGTGFVGRRVLQLAQPPVNALARRTQPAAAGVTWISGDLSDRTALARLCDGADVVIHIAGVVNAADRAGFDIGNVRGTAHVVAAAQAAGVRRFVQVSSLAAREPALSDYGASKAGADAEVQASGLDWLIVRPPGVYGPGDTEMLEVFKAASWGLGLVPGSADGRISLIHVDDLARALLTLAQSGPSREILELDDGMGDRGGYTHAEYNALIGAALGRRLWPVTVLPSVLNAAAGVATLAARLRGTLPKLSRDRARYIAHPDWVARGGNARISEVWTPQIPLEAGLAATIASYREEGWL